VTGSRTDPDKTERDSSWCPLRTAVPIPTLVVLLPHRCYQTGGGTEIVTRRATLATALLLTVVTLVRLPLWLLDGPGRDEALYRYWAHHPDLSYAPLLQGIIRVFEFAGPHSAWTLRLPMAVLGFVVLYLVDLRLRKANAASSARLIVGAAVALSPWQGFSGSILHPDNVFVVTLLLFTLAAWDGRVITSTLFAVMVMLAKPTGVLLLPIAWWMGGRLGTSHPWRVHFARIVLAAGLLLFILTMQLDMIRGIATFGQLDESLSLSARFGTASIALLFLSGPILIYLAVQGFRERVTRLRRSSSPELRREAEVTLATASVLLVFFLAAALFRGQFKPNWILPAALVLLPLTTTKVSNRLLYPGLALTLLASLGQTWVMHDPDVVDRKIVNTITGAVGTGLKAYAVHGGSEEASDSAGRHWRNYMQQYNDGSEFAHEIEEMWNAETGTETPSWIVSDDYGLAAQLHWYLGSEDARIVLVGDKTFHRTVDALRDHDQNGSILLLPVTIAGSDLSNDLEIVTPLRSVHHPATGRAITPLVGRRKLKSS